MSLNQAPPPLFALRKPSVPESECISPADAATALGVDTSPTQLKILSIGSLVEAKYADFINNTITSTVGDMIQQSTVAIMDSIAQIHKQQIRILKRLTDLE